MKRFGLALVVSLASTGAMAQSSVTIYGMVDTAVRYISYKGNGSATTLGSFGNTPSLLGFQGTEDLGGGLSALFHLETSFVPGTGQSPVTAFGMPFFNRGAWVGVKNDLGTLHLGRDWNPLYSNNWPFDPTGNLGVADSLHIQNLPSKGVVPNYIWNANAVTYFTPPSLGGIYGMFQASPRGDGKGCSGNVTCTTTIGSFVGGRIGYANGPFEIAVAVGQTGITSNTIVGASTGKWTQANLGINYDLKIMKVSLWVNANRFISSYEHIAKIALTVPFGIDYAFANAGVARTNTAAQQAGLYGAHAFGIGYVHPLSKRTNLYTAASYLKNSGRGTLSVEDVGSFTGATMPGRSTVGVEFGISHKF
ncbi:MULTISPECIES: porin [unclassified Burkholderia]|uniref:porin n=1 Tax=unclassified Burkholderia TaxID=2613784 RepID=UPI002AB0A9EC|nr:MULTISPECIES: porin [unclassified Burkholderia]